MRISILILGFKGLNKPKNGGDQPKRNDNLAAKSISKLQMVDAWKN